MSSETSAVLVTSLLDNTALDSVEHKTCVQKVGVAIRKERIEVETAIVEKMKVKASKTVRKWLKIIGRTGLWMTLSPHKIDGTTLPKEEWRDNARLGYDMRLSGLCSHRDGYGVGFTVEHMSS